MYHHRTYRHGTLRRTLVVTDAADDLQLLTTEQMRALAGVSDSSQDTALSARGLTVAAAIMTECNIAVGNGADATLWQETLTETLYCVAAQSVFLARRHNVAITSVTLDGTVVAAEDYFVDAESGELVRLSSGLPAYWSAQKMIVVYDAGFEELPAILVSAASDYFRAITLEQTRDPYVKSESVDIPGLESRTTQLWTGELPGAGSSGGVPGIVANQLTRFRNMPVY